MDISKLVSLFMAILPEAEQVASIFIHNPNSQHQFSLIVGTANALAPVVAGLTESLNTPATPAAAPAPVAAPAATAAPLPNPTVIPAGVPSAH